MTPPAQLYPLGAPGVMPQPPAVAIAAQMSLQTGHGDDDAVGLTELDTEDEAVTDAEAEGEGDVEADSVADSVAVGDAVGVGVQNAAQSVFATRQSHEAGQPSKLQSL